MGLKNIKSGGGFERIGNGTFPARISRLIDLGVQKDTYEGKTSTRSKVLIEFELPTKTVETPDGSYRKTVLKEMTLSFAGGLEKGLGQLVSAAVPTITKSDLNSYDVTQLIGKAVAVTIGTTAGGKDKVANVSGLMEGMQVDEVNSDRVIVFDFDEPDSEVLQKLPSFVISKLKTAVNFSGSKTEQAIQQFESDVVDSSSSVDEASISQVL